MKRAFTIAPLVLVINLLPSAGHAPTPRIRALAPVEVVAARFEGEGLPRTGSAGEVGYHVFPEEPADAGAEPPAPEPPAAPPPPAPPSEPPPPSTRRGGSPKVVAAVTVGALVVLAIIYFLLRR